VANTLSEGFVRFVIGSLVVSAFATIGGLFKPTSLAGLFGRRVICCSRNSRLRNLERRQRLRTSVKDMAAVIIGDWKEWKKSRP
jgi:hypothetical protein